MRIIVDILHPAHVHFFRNFITEMEREGHTLLVTTRHKDLTIPLLNEYVIPYQVISTVKKGFWGRMHELMSRNWQFYKIARAFKPDLLVSEQGPTTAPLGKILRVPSIIFWDTEVSTLTNKVCYPLASAVYTPLSYEGKVRGNHQTYCGYQKLAYLHPSRFTPKESVVEHYGLPKRYALVRFVSWTSNHDQGEHGIIDRVQFIQELANHGSVYISSEEELPAELQKYKLSIAAKDIFDVMAFASLYVGESATMATEAALLGVPSLYVATSMRGYINDLQNKYKLVFWHTQEQEALSEAVRLFTEKKSKTIWTKRRDEMLKEMIDVTSFMVDVVKNKKYLER